MVVDEARFPDPDRQHGEGSGRPEGLSVDQGGIVDPRQGLGFEDLQDLPTQALEVVLAGAV